MVNTDERRLRQVLVNLLDNAVKYTHEGGIAFKVGGHGGRIRFLVEDTGSGIDPEHLTRIFEPFRSIPRARGVAAGGFARGTSAST